MKPIRLPLLAFALIGLSACSGAISEPSALEYANPVIRFAHATPETL